MKKLFIFALAAIGLLACNGKNDPKDPSNDSATITCDPTTKIVDGLEGGEFSVTITSNAAWSATVDKSWVTITPYSGQGDAFVTVKVTAGDNDEARVLFSNGNSSTMLIINREEQVPSMLPGMFSISASKQVHFSQGNLQYQASTKTWRFANKQYDVIGNDNSKISSSYSGWIDLFCWGTGNNPTYSNIGNSNDITFVDWGGNAISNGGNKVNLWRSLTKKEWVYLFCTRTDASAKYGMASVANVHGIIVLPDVYDGAIINADHSAWDNNTISASDWAAYEASGAVFFPAAGSRFGKGVYSVGSSGNCWSSTTEGPSSQGTYSYGLSFDSDGLNPQATIHYSNGLSVRLVRDVE